MCWLASLRVDQSLNRIVVRSCMLSFVFFRGILFVTILLVLFPEFRTIFPFGARGRATRENAD